MDGGTECSTVGPAVAVPVRVYSGVELVGNIAGVRTSVCGVTGGGVAGGGVAGGAETSGTECTSVGAAVVSVRVHSGVELVGHIAGVRASVCRVSGGGVTGGVSETGGTEGTSSVSSVGAAAIPVRVYSGVKLVGNVTAVGTSVCAVMGVSRNTANSVVSESTGSMLVMCAAISVGVNTWVELVCKVGAVRSGGGGAGLVVNTPGAGQASIAGCISVRVDTRVELVGKVRAVRADVGATVGVVGVST